MRFYLISAPGLVAVLALLDLLSLWHPDCRVVTPSWVLSAGLHAFESTMIGTLVWLCAHACDCLVLTHLPLLLSALPSAFWRVSLSHFLMGEIIRQIWWCPSSASHLARLPA